MPIQGGEEPGDEAIAFSIAFRVDVFKDVTLGVDQAELVLRQAVEGEDGDADALAGRRP